MDKNLENEMIRCDCSTWNPRENIGKNCMNCGKKIKEEYNFIDKVLMRIGIIIVIIFFSLMVFYMIGGANHG
jgi:hypothetical protein